MYSKEGSFPSPGLFSLSPTNVVSGLFLRVSLGGIVINSHLRRNISFFSPDYMSFSLLVSFFSSLYLSLSLLNTIASYFLFSSRPSAFPEPVLQHFFCILLLLSKFSSLLPLPASPYPLFYLSFPCLPVLLATSSSFSPQTSMGESWYLGPDLYICTYACAAIS